MNFDIHAKSEQLLEKVGNSMHDRGKSDTFFTTQELHIVESFLREFSQELAKKMGEY